MIADGQQKPRLTKVERFRVQYRKVLVHPTVTGQEVDEMRKNVIRLAQTICEHVWGKRFY